MQLLNIIIVNWNAGDTLLKCLQSVFASDINQSLYHVYVVDNNSSDNSLDLIRDLSNNLTVIPNPTNVGFGAACNIVLKNYTSDNILLLNPDVILNTCTLGESLDFMENNKDVDVLGVLNFDSKHHVAASCARFPSTSRLINDMLGLSKIASSIFKPGTIMSDWDHLQSRDVDHVIGAYMMIRYPIIKKAGFFDEEYFLYMEDVDLSYRIKKNEGRIYYNSEISIIHEGGGTTKSIREISLSYSLQSRIIYCRKHLNPNSLLLITLLSMTVEPFVRIINSLLSLNFRDIRPIIGAYMKYYKWYFKSRNN